MSKGTIQSDSEVRKNLGRVENEIFLRKYEWMAILNVQDTLEME